MTLPFESSSTLPRTLYFCALSEGVFATSGTAGLASGLGLAAARTWARSAASISTRWRTLRSLSKASKSISAMLSSTRVLGVMSPRSTFLVCRKSITVLSATLRSFANLLILVFAMYVLYLLSFGWLLAGYGAGGPTGGAGGGRAGSYSSNSARRISSTLSTVSSSRSAFSTSMSRGALRTLLAVTKPAFLMASTTHSSISSLNSSR